MPRPVFQRVEELFHEAVALRPEARPAFLDAVCAGDADLRAAIEDLLQHDGEGAETAEFLASPVASEAGALRLAATLPNRAQGGMPGATAPLPRIPGYELLAELGRGSMGVVYKARQASLGRVVALKMLLPATAIPIEHQARFRAEAESLARLSHPNVVPIYDLGEAEGRPYFTMEYVPGPSLAQLLDGRPQEPRGSARLIEVLARAVQAVHQCGIIHRDLKPANILLGAGGTLPAGEAAAPASPVKITDFGLAKDPIGGRKLTQTGTILGTPSYMAPEQVRGPGKAIGPAADIYALGSILYEMLTGRPPFDAETVPATIDQLLNEEPVSPATLRPRLRRDLVTICLKCLEKAPRERYATALDLAEDLRRFLTGEPIQARPIGVVGRAYRWCRRRPLVAGLMALSGTLAMALLITVLVYNARLQDALATVAATAEQRRQQIVELNVNIGITELGNGDATTAVLRFTEALRLDEGHPEREHNHRERIATALRQCPRLLQLTPHARPVLCTHLDEARGWVATVDADHVLEVWDVRKDQPVGPGLRLDDVPVSGALAPDGRSIALVHKNGTVRLMDVLTGESRKLPSPEGEAVQRVAFDAEGRNLLTQHADTAVCRWDVGTPQPTRVGLMRKAAVCSAISPDGEWVALLQPDHTLRIWDVDFLCWIGKPIHPRQDVSKVAFSPDADRVVTVGSSPSVEVWHVQSGELLASASRPGHAVTHVRFSPDGRLVVTGDDAGRVVVWEAATGRAVTPPLCHGEGLAGIAFQADGRQVVTVGRASTVCVWELPGGLEQRKEEVERRSVAELVALAQVLACGRIDEKQDRQALDVSAWHARWRQLQPGR